MNAGASVSYFAMVEIALLTGLAFLLSCMLLRELAFSFGNGTISHIIGEGMLIIGWVYTNGSRSDAAAEYLPSCPKPPSTFNRSRNPFGLNVAAAKRWTTYG